MSFIINSNHKNSIDLHKTILYLVTNKNIQDYTNNYKINYEKKDIFYTKNSIIHKYSLYLKGNCNLIKLTKQVDFSFILDHFIIGGWFYPFQINCLTTLIYVKNGFEIYIDKNGFVHASFLTHNNQGQTTFVICHKDQIPFHSWNYIIVS